MDEWWMTRMIARRHPHVFAEAESTVNLASPLKSPVNFASIT